MNTIVDRELGQAGAPAEMQDDTLDLVRYWRAISRNKWRVIGLVIAIGVLASMVANSLPPIYRATATILIEANKPKIVSIEEVYNQAAGGNREYLTTQHEILKSRELVAKLVKKLNLGDHPAIDPRRQAPPFWHDWFPDGFLSSGKQATATITPELREQVAISVVQAGLTSQLVRGSQLVRITFTSGDRELAALVPNALAEIYVDSDLEARMKMTQKAMSFINGQVGELRKKLSESEQALQGFRDRERILDTKGIAATSGTSQLDSLSKSLLDARARRADAETVYNQVAQAMKATSSAALESLPAIQRHAIIGRLKEAEAEAEKRLAEASRRYGPEHPRMVTADAELKTARENFRKSIATVSQTAARELEVAKAQEATFEKALAAAKSDIQSLNRKEFQLAALERDVTTNRQLYELFIQRLKETNISTEMQTASARVVDPAIVPGGAYGPNRSLIVNVSIFAALLLGIALALLIERLDNTVKTSHDIESKLQVPVLGIVHTEKPKRGHKLERIFLDDPHCSFSESIRTARSGVMLSALDNPKKIIVVTSSVPEEGKTTIAANLGLALGQIRKTLIVDADMRRPRIGGIFGGKGATTTLVGLSELCSGAAKLEQCVYPIADTQVHVLPSGNIPPNPQELLSSHRFADTMRMLSEAFDIIIIDSPPIQLVSDALILASYATGLVYVVKADSTPYPVARVGMKKLRRVGAPIIGAVLNQQNQAKADRYYGEYSGYGKKYAKGYGYKATKA